MSHDLGLRFLSPTVNLYMNAEDFVKFCENLEHYLNFGKIEKVIDESRGYPVGRLDDITLYFVHYKTFEEACEKWYDRSKRVDYDNVRIFGSDRDGMTDELMERLEKISYPKVIFTHLPSDKPSTFYIKGYEHISQVTLDKKGWLGRRDIDQFDYVSFLNTGEI